MQKKSLSILKFLFFLGIGILLIWLAVRNLTANDKASIAEAFEQTDYFWVSVTLVLSILSHVSRAIRWRILIQPLGFNPTLSNTFFAVMVGYLANFALPRLGEVSRCGVLTKYEKIPFTEAFGTVIAERVIDLICLILIFFATLFFQFDALWGLTNDKIVQPAKLKLSVLLQDNSFMMVFGILMIGVTASFFVFRKKNNGVLNKKIKDMLHGFAEGLRSVKDIKRPYLFVFHTILIWLLYISSIFFGFLCFKETSGLGADAAFAVLIFSTIGVIFVPGGTGASQALVTETLSAIFKVSFTFAFAFAWLMWTSQFVLILLVGVISLILLPILNKGMVVKND